jgi:glucuronate isomerase
MEKKSTTFPIRPSGFGSTKKNSKGKGNPMHPFIHDDFMLQNDVAKKLYHTYVRDLPIIDFHCHLDPKAIYENKSFSTLGEVWLAADHYKWRLMRAYGCPESVISGSASFSDKLEAFAEVMPNLIGNPIFHWSQLELKRYCQIDDLLSLDTVKDVESKANAVLSHLDPKAVMAQFKVEVVGTTDDPLDSLEWHIKIKQDASFVTKILPTFRPDKAVNIELDSFIPWTQRFETLMGQPIPTLDVFKACLAQRVRFFVDNGSFIADHALDLIGFEDTTDDQAQAIFAKRLAGGQLTEREAIQFKSNMLVFFAGEYKKANMVLQLHVGAYRNVNTARFQTMGPDMGFDTIHDQPIIVPLRGLLNALVMAQSMPKTIVYSVNPNDYDVILPLLQTFQGEERGILQFGAAWWFQDNIDGMRRQMRAHMSHGVFSTFIGMLTDSRSFLSYPRHEYFRRLLCQLVSEEVLAGTYPNDEKRLGELVQNIAYYNAKRYFGF